MVVRTLCKGHGVTSLHVGVNNVRRHFPKDVAVIELLLDHLQIQCGLEPGFWRGHPEIRDPRLSAWLDSKQLHAAVCRGTLLMAMVPEGKNAFRLEPLRDNGHARPKNLPLPAPEPS